MEEVWVHQDPSHSWTDEQSEQLGEKSLGQRANRDPKDLAELHRASVELGNVSDPHPLMQLFPQTVLYRSIEDRGKVVLT